MHWLKLTVLNLNCPTLQRPAMYKPLGWFFIIVNQIVTWKNEDICSTSSKKNWPQFLSIALFLLVRDNLYHHDNTKSGGNRINPFPKIEILNGLYRYIDLPCSLLHLLPQSQAFGSDFVFRCQAMQYLHSYNTL